MVMEVEAEILRVFMKGVGRSQPDVEDRKPEDQCGCHTSGRPIVVEKVLHEFGDGIEGEGVVGGGRVGGIGQTLFTSTWARDEVGCGLVPQSRGDGEVFLVLARLCGSFDIEAVDSGAWEVAGTGAVFCGTAEAEVGAEALAVVFPSGLDGVDDVGNCPAVDGLCGFEEVVDELGDLVGVEGCGEGVPEDEVDLIDIVGGVWDVEDGVDIDGLAKRCWRF